MSMLWAQEPSNPGSIPGR